jgi:hypothetical protein
MVNGDEAVNEELHSCTHSHIFFADIYMYTLIYQRRQQNYQTSIRPIDGISKIWYPRKTCERLI